MDKTNTLIAIDLGSTHITAIAAQRQGDNLLILGEETETLPVEHIKYGIIAKPSAVAMNISKCIKLLQNRVNAEIESVFVSIGGRSVQVVDVMVTRYIGANRVVSDKVLDDMAVEAHTKCTSEDVAVFGVTPRYFVLDRITQTTSPANQSAAHVEGHYNVLVGRKLMVDNLQKCFERTGTLEETFTKADALATALLDADEREAGCAIIDFGGETTTLYIFKDGILQHQTVVPLGSKHITNDIKASFGISEMYAEKLKRSKGQALESLVTPVRIVIPATEEGAAPIRVSTKLLACVIEARLAEITSKIFHHLKEWEPSLQGCVYLTGDGSMLANLTDFVQQYVSLPVAHGSHAEWLADGTSPEYAKPKYSQLIGTAILGDTYIQNQQSQKKKKDGPKIPRGTKILKKAGDLVFKFFDDDSDN